MDLAHNLVLADSRCNGQKRDRLPALKHLAAWTERNAGCGGQIADALRNRSIVADLAASKRVAFWAYAQAEAAGGLTWVRADEMMLLVPQWREMFA